MCVCEYASASACGGQIYWIPLKLELQVVGCEPPDAGAEKQT